VGLVLLGLHECEGDYALDAVGAREGDEGSC
jgi:hypothetical protein